MHQPRVRALRGARRSRVIDGRGTRRDVGEELAKLAAEPVGNLVNVPFQNNTNFDYGPLDKTQNILNIQPVYPIHLSDE